jgi:hypothetical protein
MSVDPTRHWMRDSLGIAAIAGLAVLCCAGPALLAAGVLGGLGAWLLSPWLIGAAALLVLGVVGWRLRHRATAGGSARGELCCPSTPPTPPAADESPRVHTGRER